MQQTLHDNLQAACQPGLLTIYPVQSYFTFCPLELLVCFAGFRGGLFGAHKTVDPARPGPGCVDGNGNRDVNTELCVLGPRSDRLAGRYRLGYGRMEGVTSARLQGSPWAWNAGARDSSRVRYGGRSNSCGVDMRMEHHLSASAVVASL